jgi:hypothetical protein
LPDPRCHPGARAAFTSGAGRVGVEFAVIAHRTDSGHGPWLTWRVTPSNAQASEVVGVSVSRCSVFRVRSNTRRLMAALSDGGPQAVSCSSISQPW